MAFWYSHEVFPAALCTGKWWRKSADEMCDLGCFGWINRSRESFLGYLASSGCLLTKEEEEVISGFNTFSCSCTSGSESEKNARSKVEWKTTSRIELFQTTCCSLLRKWHVIQCWLLYYRQFSKSKAKKMMLICICFDVWILVSCSLISFELVCCVLELFGWMFEFKM